MTTEPQALYREQHNEGLRVLFCIGVTHSFFEQESGQVSDVITAISHGFHDLKGRFGIIVLGTMDDDELMVGAAAGWPWTAYILADAPDLAAVKAVCNLLRETPIGEHRLWRYLRIEARVGRQLFFGNE